MREKSLSVFSTLLCCILLAASLSQARIPTDQITTNHDTNTGGGPGTLSTNIWEDTFNNETKIDPAPPGAGQSDNYVVSDGFVSMINTYSVWTNPSWTKMKTISLTNIAGQTLYNTVVYFSIAHESAMQSDYRDIRFKHQNNPNTWLNYWIEQYNATTAQVWVKVPSIPNGVSSMFLFYGNPSATSLSNFSGVFTWSANWANDDKTTTHLDSEGAWDPDVTYGNSEFLLAWEQGQAWFPPYTWGFKQEIRGTIYNTNGVKLVDNQLIFSDGTTYYRNEDPSIDYGGGKFFVAWEHYDTVANPTADTKDIKARTVVQNGNQFTLGSVIDVCVASNAQADPNVQYDSVNNRFCVAWEDARNGITNYNIYARLYDTSGNPVGSEKAIATTTYSEFEPWVAFDPVHDHYMIVWEEGLTYDNGPFSIKAGIFDQNLNQIGSTITIATGSDSIDYNYPCVEFAPLTQRFLVTWNSDDLSSSDFWGDVWGKILDSSGSVVVNTFEIKAGEYIRTDIVPYFSSSFFVSFNSEGTAGSGLIYGKMITSTGDIVGSDLLLSIGSGALADWVNLGAGNNKIFASWEDNRITYPAPWDDMPDVYSNLWSSAIAGSTVTYVIGIERQLILSAHVTSVQIIPTAFNKWDIFNATYIDGTITFDILDGSTGALLLAGAQPGWNLYTHGITASTIRLKATFSRANPSTTPKLDKWNIKWQTNEPPNTPSSPTPVNGSTDVPVTTDLSWVGGDPNGDPVTYDVYFGTLNPPTKIMSNQSATSYDTGTMNAGTTYYWRIVSWDNYGLSAIGPLWIFTTHNDPPNLPGTPAPANGATGISITADLGWTGGDPNLGDTVTYDVYFGTTTPPTTKVSTNQSTLSYDPGSMNYNTQYYWRIIAWDNHGASTIGSIWDFTTENQAPYQPGSPSPPQGATGVAITADLSWSGGDPDGDPVTYDVYFGTSSTPPKLAANQSSTTYDLPLLNYGTTYYWKIVAWDNHGASTTGPLWNFLTDAQPYEPTNPNPSNHATGVDINANLSWTGGDPDAGDIVTYDVYFGVTNPPPKIISNQSGTTYDPGIMSYLTVYHWKIVAWDNHGASKAGQVWDFTTMYVPNNPPYTPSNPMPQNGATGVDINTNLSWTGGDPDPGDTVTYDVYFGTTNPPPLVAVGHAGTTYDPGTLGDLTTYYWKIVAWDNRGASTEGPLWDFTTAPVPNQPPYTPQSPTPINHASGVGINANLQWIGGDPDGGDTVTYDVYFGTTNPPPKLISNQSVTLYIPGTMNYLTTYYWKIVAWDNHGASSVGPVWDFTTENEVNNPPYIPSDPQPENHATAVDVNTNLSWNGGDPDSGDTVTYDICLGTTNPPPKIVSNQTGTSYDPGTMEYLTVYYWRIISWDNHGASTQGSIWDFTTMEEPNYPPFPPSDPSPPNGSTNVTLGSLSWTGGDPDGDPVTYDVYFGFTNPPAKIIANQSGTNYDVLDWNYSTQYYWKIVAWDDQGAFTVGPLWTFVTIPEPNNPPYTPGTPSPANGTTGVSIDAILSWSGGDPDVGDTATYDVYFGTTPSPPLVASNQTDTGYDPGLLSYTTTYYWMILAWDNHGASTQGPLWHFTTRALPNDPPYTPSNPSPEDGATNVNLTVTISWNGGDPDAGDIVTYDVYFGTSSPPLKLANNITDLSYLLPMLNETTLYYWQIIAWDNHGASTEGPIWSFRTTWLNDSYPPTVTITKPENAIYFLNKKIMPFFTTVVIFMINVEVNASDNESGVAKVEFFVDDESQANDTTAPYSWDWEKQGLFVYTLKVVAYDYAGHSNSTEMRVWKIF